MQNDRHSDPLDEASALAASLTEAAIAAVRQANEPEKHPDFDGETCVDCGDDIPANRLALGKVRCVPCQSRKEHLGRQVARPGWNSDWNT
ncbi:TraR/DksA C4-type zinc finger protein [Comamonas thiooxydans]|uniref:TraR/DksA C4-type zinc finger protein n=1 Tax=Comamonas thiooxydans TaxID=363952 RepID=UPI001554D9EB